MSADNGTIRVPDDDDYRIVYRIFMEEHGFPIPVLKEENND